ncbi:transposable element Tcb2 transposase [Trichonephila clavipes]|nr:transposable element Tcb2 transposase [Trichonephila clavipes]
MAHHLGLRDHQHWASEETLYMHSLQDQPTCRMFRDNSESHRNAGAYTSRVTQVAHQVTTPNENRYLAVTAKRNRWSTASDLSRQLSSATGTTVSSQTVYRRLGHIGLYARRPVRCFPLTATHCGL